MKYLLSTLLLISTKLMAIEFTYTENDSSGTNIALGYPVPLPVDSLTPIDGFRSYNSLNLRHQQLSAQSSNIQSIILGNTFNNRPIMAYQLSDADNDTISGGIEGSALINGGIHAREWQSPEAVTGYMETLFDNQNNQYIEQYILENLNLVVIPVLNIDGFLQTQRFPDKVISSSESPRDGRMRRKNMRNTDESLSTANDNFNGIDLNRNNNPYWATNPDRSSNSSVSIVYHGAGAASEPEIQALQQAAIEANESRLRFYTDTHSFSQIYFTPFTSNERRNNIAGKLANIMRAANDYKYQYGPAAAGGGIGATDEYFAETYQIPSYTLELEPLNSGRTYGGFGVSHDGFILPASEVNRMRQETSAAAMAGLYTIAEPPILQEIIISQGANTVIHQAWQKSDNGRRLNTLINNELSPDVNYQLTLVFNKPMRQLAENIPTDFSGLSEALGISLSWLVKTASGETSAVIDTSTGNWLVSNFNRYKTDSFQVSFTMPNEFNWSNTELLALNVDTTDMTGQTLDTNPATIADWQFGEWQYYEDSNGEYNDIGGTDKSMRLIDDASALYSDVSNPTNPTTPDSSNTSSGGGCMFWLLCVAILRMSIPNKDAETRTC